MEQRNETALLIEDINSPLWLAARKFGWALVRLYPGRLDTGEQHRHVNEIADAVVGIVAALRRDECICTPWDADHPAAGLESCAHPECRGRA